LIQDFLLNLGRYISLSQPFRYRQSKNANPFA
jgi:hypothetical protein